MLKIRHIAKTESVSGNLKKTTMAYITKANAVKILRKINLNDIPDISGEVYKKPIYFLSKSETKYLLLMQSLLKEPEKFAIEVYHPVVNKDTFQYVFESGQRPSYHSNKNCERLTSNFKNFEIPSEIKARVRERVEKEGKNEQEIIELEKQQVEVFRVWFNKNFELFNSNTEEFLKKLDIRWNIQRNVRQIERDYSGVKTIDNLNLSELEAEIDKIISEAGRYFVNNKDKQHIIRRFQKLTILAYRKENIDINETELSDDELRQFLLEYDTKFKKPIKELLIQYYRVRYNPDLSFEGQLLERLNFRACSVCAGVADFNYVIKDKALASAALLTFSIENVEVKFWKSGQVSFRATCDKGEVVTFWESTADRVLDEIAPGKFRLKAGVEVAKDGGLIPPESRGKVKDKALESTGLLTFSVENVSAKASKSGQVGFRAVCDNGEVVTFWESTADRVLDEIAPGKFRLKAGVEVAKDGGLIPPKLGFWA